jgi:DNA-binding NarL/FixJ family response regulator
VIRLVLADDHPVFAQGLRAVFDAETDVTVERVAATGRAALDAITEHRPEVAVLDIAMPDGDGLWVAAQIRAAGLPTRVLMLTMADDEENVFAALRAGASGYTVKGAGPDEIVAAVRAVARGEAVFGAGIAERVLTLFSQGRSSAVSPFPELTPRELEMLELIAGGLDNPTIARRLFLSEKTVRNRVSAILTKLHARSRAEMVALARDAGLGGPADSGR